MCSVFKMRFKGFRVNFNLSSEKTCNTEYDSGPGLKGAYRIHKEDINGYGHIYNQNPQAKLPKPVANPPPRPSMVNLPQDAKLKSGIVIRATKSTGDLTQTKNIPSHLNSSPDVSYDPRGGPSNRNSTEVNRTLTSKETKVQEKELKKLDKKRIAEQKKREKTEAQQRAKQEKMAAKERARHDKLRKEREIQAKTKQQAKTKKPSEERMNPLAQTSTQYSTNTLESSISKSSGPPPYSEPQRAKPEVIPNENDNTGNTSFSKRPSMFSWDKIAQHKQEINRPTAATVSSNKNTKQTVLDLNYENQPRKSIDV